MPLFREETGTGSLTSGEAIVREASPWAEPTATDAVTPLSMGAERLLQAVALGGALTSLTPGLSLRHLESLRFTSLGTSTICDLRFASNAIVSREVPSTNIPAEMLAAIRALLSLTVVETAQVLEVERPTVYAWLAGRAEPQARNRERLQQVFRVARDWSRLSNRPLGCAVRYLDDEGNSVLSLLAERRDDEATSLLASLARREARAESPRPVASVRDVLMKRGLGDRIRPSMEEVNRITGKRLGPG